MFQLTVDEFENLRFQIGTSSSEAYGGRRYLPYVFTEHGVTMLSAVLRSPIAVKVNIEVVRAFIRLRQVLSEHKDLEARVTALEKKYDSQFKAVFEAIRQLLKEPVETAPKRKIGLGWRRE